MTLREYFHVEYLNIFSIAISIIQILLNSAFQKLYFQHECPIVNYTINFVKSKNNSLLIYKRVTSRYNFIKNNLIIQIIHWIFIATRFTNGLT